MEEGEAGRNVQERRNGGWEEWRRTKRAQARKVAAKQMPKKPGRKKRARQIAKPENKTGKAKERGGSTEEAAGRYRKRPNGAQDKTTKNEGKAAKGVKKPRRREAGRTEER